MPNFEIEQYELHSMKYRVEADSRAEAIKKLLHGEGQPVDDSLEYIGIAEDLGLPIAENLELADELQKIGVRVPEHVIPSIRSIRAVE